MTTGHSRRRFLSGAVGGVGAAMLSPMGAASGQQIDQRLRLAVFGNMYNAEHFLTAAHIHHADIVAVCNPDQRKLPAVIERWREQAKTLSQHDDPQRRQDAERYQRLADRQGVAFYQDVRRMFDQMHEGIDALVVSDYDHFHGVACGAAMSLGKPVCSERPIGLTIEDARQLRALAAETGVPTTYRSPGTGTGLFRQAMEWVEDGVIGDVRAVHVWFKRGGPDRDQLPSGVQSVPEGLDWDLWLGPLPWREYHGDWMAYAHWRETSNGGLGSFGPHTFIFPYLTLKLRQLWDGSAGDTTIDVSAECSRLNRISFPRWERIRWELPARGSMPPVVIHWHHGPDFAPGTRKRIHQHLRRFGVVSSEQADDLMRTAGSLLIGSDGALVADDHSVRITGLPRGKFAEIESGRPQRIPASQGIYGDWIAACRGGSPHILASFDNGGPLSELLMLGNIATRYPQQTIRYDPVAGQITAPAEANQLRGYAYREGWKIK